MIRDGLQAVRALLRRPALSILMVLILALCLGGNTAILSAAYAVLFRSMPFEDTDRLVIVTERFLPTGEVHNSASWLDVVDWQKQQTVFTATAPFLHWSDRVLILEEGAERVGANFVSSDYFKLLGVEAALGRTFSPEEDVIPSTAPRVILSHRVWTQHFSSDPAIVGKQVRVNNGLYEVIGVMPEDFRDIPNVPHRTEVADIWLPVSATADAFGTGIFESRSSRVFYVLARLKPGVTVAQAHAEMERIAEGLRQQYPDTNEDYGAMVHTFADFIFEELRPSMQALLVGGVFVLLVGFANVANLLLVRALERRRELSVRLALGAGRMRLVRQMFAESLVLAILGGALGLLFAVWGIRLLEGSLELPPFVRIGLDPEVLLISLAATLLTGLAFGLALALNGTRVTPRDALQGWSAAGGSRQGHLGRNVLVVAEVFIAVILLIGAGLMFRSFQQLHSTRTDFKSDRLLTMRLDLATNTYDDPVALLGFDQVLLDAVAEVPGVDNVALWGPGMPGRDNVYFEVSREGAEEPGQRVRTDRHHVSPGAVKMLGIPLLRGRDFTEEDTAQSQRVVLISQSLADALWPGQNPIGKRLRSNPAAPFSEVVGVFANVRLRNRLAEREHDLLLSMRQVPSRDLSLLVQARTDPGGLSASLRDAVRKVDPQIPVFDVATMDQRLHEEEGEHRLNAALMGSYAVLALLLALLGIYAVLSYSVAQRTKEIGVRVALGAGRPEIFRLVLGKGMALVGLGLLLGVAGALAVTRLLERLLYGVSPTDPFTFIAIALLFLLTALLASFLPARRAVTVEPTTALRYD